MRKIDIDFEMLHFLFDHISENDDITSIEFNGKEIIINVKVSSSYYSDYIRRINLSALLDDIKRLEELNNTSS